MTSEPISSSRSASASSSPSSPAQRHHHFSSAVSLFPRVIHTHTHTHRKDRTRQSTARQNPALAACVRTRWKVRARLHSFPLSLALLLRTQQQHNLPVRARRPEKRSGYEFTFRALTTVLRANTAACACVYVHRKEKFALYLNVRVCYLLWENGKRTIATRVPFLSFSLWFFCLRVCAGERERERLIL